MPLTPYPHQECSRTGLCLSSCPACAWLKERRRDAVEWLPRVRAGVDYGAASKVICRNRNYALVWRLGFNTWSGVGAPRENVPAALCIVSNSAYDATLPELDRDALGLKRLSLSHLLVLRWKTVVDKYFGKGTAQSLRSAFNDKGRLIKTVVIAQSIIKKSKR